MSALVSEVISDAQAIVGEVSGSGTQTYSEDRMLLDVVRCFNLLFKKYHWPQYIKWYSSALDGTLGVVTTDLFTNVKDFEDFFVVYRDGQETPLPIMSRMMNPYRSTGTRVQYWTSLHVTDTNYEGRKLQFYPKASTEVVNIGARLYPVTAWMPSSTMYFDRDMLAYGTAYMTLSGDDLNPSAADANRAMMEMRFKDITASLAARPLAVSGQADIPVEWY